MPIKSHHVELAGLPHAAFSTKRHVRPFAGWLLTGLLLCAATSLVHAETTSNTCRVTTAGLPANSGASWAQAKSLMNALSDYSCTEVWVAEGVYTPPVYSPYFNIRSNVQIYGGFLGNESSRSQRDPVLHLTVLSGDMDHDDTNVDGNFVAENVNDIQGNNSHRLIRASGNTSNPITSAVVLDGFTITGADGRPEAGGFGGGLYCYGIGAGNECSPTLRNLVFSGNTASLGGAIYLGGGGGGNSSPLIDHVTFVGNEAEVSGGGQSYGGGLFCNGANGGTCNPTLTHVIFRDNYSHFYGGGMFNDGRNGGDSSPTLIDVSFEDNGAYYSGGAMMNFGYGGESSPSLLNVTFDHNSSASGGAMYNNGSFDLANSIQGITEPVLRNVTFSDNHATARGGAIYNWGEKSGIVNLTLTNVTFHGNNAGTDGGAIFSTARDSGYASVTLKNVILWDNTASDGHALFFDDTDLATTILEIDYSIIEGGDAGIANESGATSTKWSAGSFNSDGNPMLSALGNHGGFTATMLPGVGGTAVDNGSCVGVPPTDQRGVGRAVGPGCDIGSVEAQSDSIFQSGFE